MPVYYSMMMIFLVIAGLTILGEASSYPAGHLVGIAFGLIISVAGILVLGMKKTSLTRKKSNSSAAPVVPSRELEESEQQISDLIATPKNAANNHTVQDEDEEIEADTGHSINVALIDRTSQN